MNKIKVLEMSHVRPGMSIAEVDDDAYPFGTFVDPQAYVPEEQDWLQVLAVTGYVDLPTITFAYHDGTQDVTRAQASATVWVLCGPDGQPLEAREE